MLTNQPPIQLETSYLFTAAKRFVRDADISLRIVPSLRISGVLIQIPHTPTCRSERQINFNLYLSTLSCSSARKIPDTPTGEEGGC
jgi:hypothetical protein